jgi:plastocyanin domain-containing protein
VFFLDEAQEEATATNKRIKKILSIFLALGITGQVLIPKVLKIFL